MEPISKSEIKGLDFDVKRSLRQGDITVYDALEAMARKIDEQTDYVNNTSETLASNEDERNAAEQARQEAERHREEAMIQVATTESDGLMGHEDKAKLDSLPTSASLAASFDGKVNKADAVGSLVVTGMETTVDVEIYDADGTYKNSVSIPAASSIDAGVMLPGEKQKLSDLPTNTSLSTSLNGKATKTDVDSLAKAVNLNTLFSIGAHFSAESPLAIGLSNGSETAYNQFEGNSIFGSVSRKFKFYSNKSDKIRVWCADSECIRVSASDWDHIVTTISTDYESMVTNGHGKLIEVTMNGTAGIYKGEADLSVLIRDTKYAFLLDRDGTPAPDENTIVFIQNVYA